MTLKIKLIFILYLVSILFCSVTLIGQNTNEPTKSNNKNAPIIEVKKKVFFDVDWNTWFVFKGVKEKPLAIRLFSNQPITGYDAFLKSKDLEKKLHKDILPSKSKIRFKTRVKYPDSKALSNVALYLKSSDGSQSNEIPVDIAYRRFSSVSLKLEVLRQNIEFDQILDGEIVKATTTRSSLNLNYHIVDFLIGIAGVTMQYSFSDYIKQTNTSITIDDFNLDNINYGYFFNLKPIRLRRLLVAPYYLRRFYNDKYTFKNVGGIIDGINLIKTKEDQFGIDAFLLFKNKRSKEHKILNLAIFYQFANQTNTSDFLLKDKRGFGFGLNYSIWID